MPSRIPELSSTLLALFRALAKWSGWIVRGLSSLFPRLRANTLTPASPDGRRGAVGFDAQIWTYDLARDTMTRLTFLGNGVKINPAWTPEGKQVAFQSAARGPCNIYWQLADGSGDADRSGNKMMSVEISTQPAFTPDKPRMLFEDNYIPTNVALPNYSVSPDGQRLLMVKENEQLAPPTQINVVLNRFEQLKQKVPTGKE